MNISKLTVGVTSAAVILGCAGVTYLIFNYKRKLRDAAVAFDYLTIKIVTNAAECEVAVLQLRKRCKYHHAVGFDCEWVTDNGKRKPVSLLQLSTYDGYCCLFRLNEMGGSMPLPLKELLEDETIYKVGVAPDDDARYLHLDYKIFLKASLDVRHIANLCGYDAGGLGALSQSLLGVMLDKSWRIRCSDWEAEELAERQVKYAAADAHVAIRIFVKLIDDLSVKKIWSLFKRRNGNIWNNLDRLCWQFTDIHYKARNAKPVDNTVTKEKASVKKEGIPMSKRYPHATRSKPLYHNCFLEAPDGELLCTCDNKKAMWYVDKDLADVIKEDPLTVRLRFEPSGRSVGDVGRYYQLTKENKCVVCGATNSYIRKNVVPREYRKYLPEIMKDHSSHDVVLLCASCHQRSNVGDQRVRERLAALCDAPLASRDCTKYTEDVTCKKIRSAARALLYQSRKHVLPEARRKELESILLEHFPLQEEVTEELLKEAAEMQVVFENAEYECHGQKVVQHFTARDGDGGLLRLEQAWREHFLRAMRPRHMPHLWSVNHNEERLRVRLKEGRLSEEELKLLGVSK